MSEFQVLESLLSELDALKQYKRASVPSSPTSIGFYSSGGLFDTCTNEQLINATVSQPGVANWLDWRASAAERNEMGIMTFIGRLTTPDYTPPATECADCEDQSTMTFCEWCYLFGGYCSQQNVLNALSVGMRPCDRYPTFRLLGALTDDMGNVIDGGAQGLQINNDYELAAIRNGRSLATIVAEQMWNGAGAGTQPHAEMLGLSTLVNTIWQTRANCLGAEPDVKDFQGTCIGDQYAGYSICDYLQYIIDQIFWRAQGGLNAIPEAGDIGIWAPPNIARELLHEWDCCRAQRCVPAATGNTVRIESDKGDSRYRTGSVQLMGTITFDQGIEVPVYADHNITHTRAGTQETGDIYVLTKAVRGIPVLWGEYQDFRQTVPAMIRQNHDFEVSDDGRFLHVYSEANTCISNTTYVRPRIILHAPFLQGRITNVCANALQFLPTPDEVYGGINTPSGTSCDDLVS